MKKQDWEIWVSIEDKVARSTQLLGVEALDKWSLKYREQSRGPNKMLPVKDPAYYRFVYQLAPSLSTYVELGCYRGWCATHVHTRNPDAVVVGIDPCPDLEPEIQATARMVELAPDYQGQDRPADIQIGKGLEIWKGRSTDLAATSRWGDRSIDVLFIDSAHTYEVTKFEYEWWGARVRKGGLILFDDIAHEPYGCAYFWNELKADKRVYMTLHNIFGFGVVIK